MLCRAILGQNTLVEALLRGWHIQRGVLGEEIDWFQSNLDDLHRHDGEVFNPWYVVDTKLDPDDNVIILHVILTISERTHTGTTARLVGVFSSGVELAVPVGCDVNVVVCELGTFVVERFLVREHLLEGRNVNFVGDGFSVDWVLDGGVLDLEGAVDVVVEIVAAGDGDRLGFNGVTDTVGVEVAAWHGVRFVVDNGVERAVEHRVHTERKDVLVMGGEYTGVHDCTPWDGETFIDRLGGEDTGGADLVHKFSGLVELEGENVLVVCDGENGLENELSVADDGCTAGSVVGVFPSDAVVLFVNTDYVWHFKYSSFVIIENGGEVVDGTKTITSELKVVCSDTCTYITEIESSLSVEWVTRIGIWNVHIRKRQSVEERAPIIVNIVENHAFS